MNGKKKSKDKKGKNNLLKKYNSKQAKKSGKFTALKTGVDVLGSAAVAPAIGAGLGIFAPVAGLVMLVLGHYLGDKSGILRLTGAATIGYGIAKAKENRMMTNQNFIDGAKTRFINLKDDWMQATYLDKLIKNEPPEENTIEGIGAIDLSELDAFDKFNEQSAVNFETQRVMDEDETFLEDEEFQEDELEGVEYEVIEEIDLSTI